MKKLLIILLLFVSCGGSSSGQPCSDKDCPVGIKMVHINTPLSFEFIDAEKIVREAVRFLNNNTTVKFEYVGGLSMEDRNPDTATLENFQTTKKRFEDYRDFFWVNPQVGGNYKKRELTMIVDRPLIDANNTIYTAGRANICALYDRGSIGVSYVTPFTNSDPNSGSFSRTFEEMFNRAANVTAHEIGHLVGALHKNTCQMCIMNGNGRNEVHQHIDNFIVDPGSVQEMENCVRRETRRTIVNCRRNTETKRHLRRCKKRKDIRHIRLRDVRFKGNQTRSLTQADEVVSDIFGD